MGMGIGITAEHNPKLGGRESGVVVDGWMVPRCDA